MTTTTRDAHAIRTALMNAYKPEINALKEALSARQAEGTEWTVTLELVAHGPAHSGVWDSHIQAKANNGEYIWFGNTMDGDLATSSADNIGWIAAWYAADGECQLFTDPGSSYDTIAKALDALV
ncbi:hypothetical protein PBI_GRAY_71 [Gordonia phage Gray]|nr:hypothetical protein PBI_GRAY_71 [Gordonia phage Gray]